jgi:aldose 1-epimerase
VPADEARGAGYRDGFFDRVAIIRRMVDGSALPSGKQYPISHAGQLAVVTEVGAGLRHYSLDGRDLLDGYSEREMCPAARGPVLIPWPNRLADGRYVFRGRSHQTPLTEPGKGNAIHGLTRWINWEALRHDADQVTMGLRLHPQPGYPFTLDVEIEYRLAADGLSVLTTARNAGADPLPYGEGHHPYLNTGTELIDEAYLRLPALLRMEFDKRLIPTGRITKVEGTEYDFLEPRRLGKIQLDTTFTGLLPGPDGITRVDVLDGDRNRRLTIWMDQTYQYVQVFTADTLEDPGRRRRSIALEPMTCAPNAFQTGQGLIVLEPGEAFRHSWGLAL